MPDYRLGIRTEVRDDASRPLANINRALGEVGDAAEDAGNRSDAALRDLERAADRAGRSNSLDNVGKEFDKIGRDAEAMARDGKESFNQLERAGDGFDLKGARDEISKTGDALDDFKEGLSLPALGAGFLGGMVGGAAAAGIGAVAGAFGAATEAAADTETATARLQTQLSITADEAERYRDTATEMFLGVYGESVADNIQALSTTEQIMRRLGGTRTQDDLQRVAEQALGIQDAFGSDMADNVRAAVALMDSFGVTGDQAMGFIVTGFQRGLDSSGDFLDSVGEYSNQFAAGGANAGEFFSVLETGLGAGVLGTDKIADAFKEFNIRITDGSKTTGDALAQIGIDYDTLAAGFADGSVTQIEAMDTVIAKIREIEDPVQRNIVGVALFGTQWEDTTADVILNIDTQKTKVGELEGGVNDLGLQYNTTTIEVETAMRKWELAFVPVAGSWNQLRADVVSGGAEMVTSILAAGASMITWYNNLPEPLRLFLFGGAGAILALPSTGTGGSFQTVAPGKTGSPVFGPAAPGGVPFGESHSPAAPNLVTRPVSGPINIPGVGAGLRADGAPAGWVGAWNPSMGGGVVINQTFNGPANADDARQGVIDAARRAGLR